MGVFVWASCFQGTPNCLQDHLSIFLNVTDTLLGTNISPKNDIFQDDVPNFPRWDMLISCKLISSPGGPPNRGYPTLVGWIFQTSQLPGEDAAEVIYQLGTLETQNVDNPNTPRKSMGISLVYRNWWNKHGVLLIHALMMGFLLVYIMCCSYFLWGWLSERRVCQWLQKPTAAEE